MRVPFLSAGLIKPRQRLVLLGVGVAVLLSVAVLPGLAHNAARPAGHGWRPSAGFRPLTDTQAARRVHSAPENRPGNRAANAYMPSPDELRQFHRARDDSGERERSRNPYFAAVTGHFTGTTDEIIQWGAQKWGIPGRCIRALYF